MSDLVRRVAFRIRAEQYLRHKEEDQARAAIVAVAEWLDDALKDDDGRIYVPQFLRAQLEQPK